MKEKDSVDWHAEEMVTKTLEELSNPFNGSNDLSKNPVCKTMANIPEDAFFGPEEEYSNTKDEVIEKALFSPGKAASPKAEDSYYSEGIEEESVGDEIEEMGFSPAEQPSEQPSKQPSEQPSEQPSSNQPMYSLDSEEMAPTLDQSPTGPLGYYLSPVQEKFYQYSQTDTLLKKTKKQMKYEAAQAKKLINKTIFDRALSAAYEYEKTKKYDKGIEEAAEKALQALIADELGDPDSKLEEALSDLYSQCKTGPQPLTFKGKHFEVPLIYSNITLPTASATPLMLPKPVALKEDASESEKILYHELVKSGYIEPPKTSSADNPALPLPQQNITKDGYTSYTVKSFFDPNPIILPPPPQQHPNGGYSYTVKKVFAGDPVATPPPPTQQNMTKLASEYKEYAASAPTPISEDAKRLQRLLKAAVGLGYFLQTSVIPTAHSPTKLYLVPFYVRASVQPQALYEALTSILGAYSPTALTIPLPYVAKLVFVCGITVFILGTAEHAETLSALINPVEVSFGKERIIREKRR